MALNIPKEDTASITRIKDMSESSMGRLISALKSAPPLPDPNEMADWLAKQVPSLSGNRLADMLATVYTLYEIREFSGVPPPRFLADLMDGIRQIPELQLAPKELSKFQSLNG